MPRSAVVVVDPDLGEIEILDYVIVADGGRSRQSMVCGRPDSMAAWEGIGTGCTKKMPVDESGSRSTKNAGDYLLRGPGRGAGPRLDHMETTLALYAFGARASARAAPLAPPGRSQCRQRCVAVRSVAECCSHDQHTVL